MKEVIKFATWLKNQTAIERDNEEMAEYQFESDYKSLNVNRIKGKSEQILFHYLPDGIQKYWLFGLGWVNNHDANIWANETLEKLR